MHLAVPVFSMLLCTMKTIAFADTLYSVCKTGVQDLSVAQGAIKLALPCSMSFLCHDRRSYHVLTIYHFQDYFREEDVIYLGTPHM